MNPFARGRIFPETRSVGRAKRSLDALLWLPNIAQRDFEALDQIEILRSYLGSIVPSVCGINLLIPESLVEPRKFLNSVRIPFATIPLSLPNPEVSGGFEVETPDGMKDAAATALACNADMVVVSNGEWFPYFREFDNLNLLLANPAVMMNQCEIFARGFDIPWSFDHPAWDEPWTSFYTLSERNTFQDAFRFLEVCHKKKIDASARETARMLVHNRLPNLCFTRDRLLFYDLQQAAAKRAGWQRQEFAFEAGYYLNFYYLLIYGGFDHLALVVNGALALGLSEKQVGARYKPFLDALESKAPEVYSLFTDPELVTFIERTGAIRHFAAHRGSIMPTKVYERPDIEPTDEELNAEIQRSGRDFSYIPKGPIRESLLETERYKLRLSKYKKVFERVIQIELAGRQYLISPMHDIEWNFNRYRGFMVLVLNACAKKL
jgi:hypothetical protein